MTGIRPRALRAVSAIALLLSMAPGVSAAHASGRLRVGPADYVRGTVPVSVTDARATRVRFELQRDGASRSTISVASTSGRFSLSVRLSSDTTVLARAFDRAGSRLWDETRFVARSAYLPRRPILNLRPGELVRSLQALNGSYGARTTSVSIEVKRRAHWTRTGSVAVGPDSSGRFTIARVSLPANRSDIRVVARNGFGSIVGDRRSAYNLGSVPALKRIVVVDKSSTRVWVIRDGMVTFSCRCAVGMPWTPTPTGLFRLGGRHRPPNAVWGPWRLRLSRHVVRGGVVRHVPTRFYMHGTNQPSSIGHMASHGCVRLLNRNIRKLSTIIDGYHVLIRE